MVLSIITCIFLSYYSEQTSNYAPEPVVDIHSWWDLNGRRQGDIGQIILI